MINKSGILVMLILSSISCSCQSENNSFKNFIAKFPLCTLPIETEKYFDKMNIYANSACNIQEGEYISFLNFKDGWKYELYSKNKPSYYNYVTGCRLSLNANHVGLLYFRAYFSDNELDEKSEMILSIYDKDGTMISHIPISGSHSDSLTFSSIFRDANDIEINYQSNSIGKYTKHFKITKDGIIQPLK